ncbi:MAG TPA: glycosyltransferase family 9 protein [Bryobacteraceae bacterium]|jgi:heptosyltransferase-3|nr:glycosyltransferase family 9 protein [Bryobacteraceae bacterium]
MTNVLDRLPSGARVAIIRLRSLGDCVLTTPALCLLKQARPDLQIALVVEDRFAAVFAGNPDVDQILAPNASSVSRFRPQLALNVHGGATSVRLMLAAASGLRAGFGHFRFQPMYNLRIPRAQEILGVDRKVHTAEHLASAMFYLGVPETEIPRARLFAGPHAVLPPRPRPYAVLHPFASEAGKTWPRENFLAVAEHLDKNLGMEPVFIAGADEDLSALGEYSRLQGAPLEEVKALISGSALFIGNDSGPAHIAAAFGRPVVALWGSSDLDNWRPWRTTNVVLASPGGIHSIQVSEVADAVETLIPLRTPQASA